MRAALSLLLCLLLAFTPGCGTIFFLFLPQPLDVSTTPTGAALTVDHVPLEDAVTPTAVPLWTGADHQIEATFTDAEGNVLKGRTTVGRKVRTWAVFLDCVFTLGIGMLVDYLSGAMYALDRDRVWINLGQHQPGAVGGPAVLSSAAPCAICGDPRGNISPCPHCGMD